ncbi:zinc finger protein 1 homolog isoform X2 [Cryptotermes secundus]|uniref:zinc finger protein 1 homolog isoform X2 n=1 Tax=Cryptotermes secundus TaxID=105785 RepID=UPI000CD7C62D|nr:zinc finger protein 1 homolog isoform X2 [Cryptotermes secundus]
MHIFHFFFSLKIEAISCHCLICNVAVCDIAESSHNVFGQLKTSDSSRVSVFEKVGQVLNRNLHSINLHSEVVCGRCFNLLIEYEETKCKLQTIRLDLLTKFETTANKHQTAVTEVSRKPAELEDNSHKSDDNQTVECSDMTLLVITDEGKVVDRNGKEKDTRVKSRRVRTKRNASLTSVGKPKPYVCTVCGKGFRAFSHRVEHMLIHLGEKPWSCGECKKAFRTKSALRVHCTKHSGDRPYTCQQCGKSFLDRYYFEEHCRIHSGERPFVCTYCQRPFARKKDLAIHTKNHTGDKPHKCTFCSKTFAVKSRLDRHSRIHSGEKPHHCEYCDKSFARRDDYKVHVRLHTGERPFHCAVCSRTFTNQSNCLVHVRIHEGSKQQYSCPLCNQTFDRRSKVDRHITVHHSNVSNKQASEINAEGPIVPSAIQVLDAQIQNLAPLSLQHLGQVQVESVDTPALSHPDSVNETISQSLLHTETLQNLTVTDLHTLQTLPVTQVAQLEWSDGTTAGTTTTYVNIAPGTYVNIVN